MQNQSRDILCVRNRSRRNNTHLFSIGIKVMAKHTNSSQFDDCAKSNPEMSGRAHFIRNRLIEFQKKCRDSGKFVSFVD